MTEHSLKTVIFRCRRDELGLIQARAEDYSRTISGYVRQMVGVIDHDEAKLRHVCEAFHSTSALHAKRASKFAPDRKLTEIVQAKLSGETAAWVRDVATRGGWREGLAYRAILWTARVEDWQPVAAPDEMLPLVIEVPAALVNTLIARSATELGPSDLASLLDAGAISEMVRLQLPGWQDYAARLHDIIIHIGTTYYGVVTDGVPPIPKAAMVKFEYVDRNQHAYHLNRIINMSGVPAQTLLGWFATLIIHGKNRIKLPAAMMKRT